MSINFYNKKNLAYSTVRVAPSPAGSGLTLSVENGHEDRFPEVPFKATVCAAGEVPTPENATVVIVTAIDGGTGQFTFTREAEGSEDRDIQVGDQIFNSITVADQVAFEIVTAATIPDVNDRNLGHAIWISDEAIAKVLDYINGVNVWREIGGASGSNKYGAAKYGSAKYA